MKKRFKYPKFLLFILAVFIAYLIFQGKNYTPLYSFISSLGVSGVFISGIFYTYSFTSPPATALLLLLAKQNSVIFSAMLGGIGALLGDLLIFSFIKYGFKDEIEKLRKENLIKRTSEALPKIIKKYVLPVLAIIAIASPLPDEIGVSLLAFYKKMPIYIFIAISYVANTLGILIILLIGQNI